MKKITLLFLCFVGIGLFSCDEGKLEPGNTELRIEKLSGTIQKGPFLSGTSIIISELDSNLVQTGNAYFTQITNDRGDFELDLELESNYVMLRADGFYFNEITGKPSTSQISLYALSDISDVKTINVNILSHLERPRIEYLLEQGLLFADAKKQAQREVLSIFNIESDNIRSSEQLDISQEGDDNAMLLATSILVQGYRTEGELSELLSNISTDLKEDGELSNSSYGTQLINHARLLNNSDIRNNIELRFKELDVESTIPDFEKRLDNFVSNTEFEFDNFITYPKEGLYGANVLSDSILSYKEHESYSFAAHLPVGTKIKIVVKPVSGFEWEYGIVSGNRGEWQSTSNYPANVVYEAVGSDKIVVQEIALRSSSSMEFLIYENDDDEVSKKKIFTW